MDLSRVGDREGLKSRREPYWQRLRPGCFLGYRPSAREGAGTWIARAYDEDRRKYRLQALGDFGELPAKDRFAAAKADAESFAATLAAGGELQVDTVGAACRRYAKANPEAEGRFKRHVYGDPIEGIQLAKLRRRNVEELRERLTEKPALVTRRKGGETVTRPRSLSAINRDMAMLRAALNMAKAKGDVATDIAWLEALKAHRNADRRRTLYLDRDQRRALLASLAADAAAFVGGLCRLPLRPGALAHLNVADFDKRTAELTIGKDKDGRPRRILLPPQTGALLAVQTKDKLPSAPLFTRANGERWSKESWKKPIATAAKAAGLPSGTTAYTLRHSTITDLVNGGLPLLTVAQISGTSAEMIERHYGHLTQAAATEALAGLAL